MFPHRRTPGLSRHTFTDALARAFAREREAAEEPKPAAPPLQDFGQIVAAAKRFFAAVGMPQLAEEARADPKRKAATVVELTEGPRGQVFRLQHKGSKTRLDEALDAAAEIARALGFEVAFREMMTTANIGDYRGSLTLAPMMDRRRPSLSTR